MSTYVTDWKLDGPAGPLEGGPTRVLLVVGFDGTPSSERALRSAIRLLHGRSGLVEVVYVAQAPAAVALTANAIVETQAAFDQEQRLLAERCRAILEPSGVAWHFQRRDGTVAHELLTVAEELTASADASTRVVLVLGGSAHRVHRYLNSVPQKVVRSDRFDVVVVR
jgi:nucleotide-binding universal stress UspA family protein